MDWRLIGIGLSVTLWFARYVFPAIPKPIMFGGFAVGISIAMKGVFSSFLPGPAVLGILSLGGLIGAITWHIQGLPKQEIQQQTSRRAPANPASPAPTANSTLHDDVPHPSQRRLPSKNIEFMDKNGLESDAPAAIESTTPPINSQEKSRRVAILRQLTELYILDHDGISSRMMAGMEFPPPDFLNEELGRKGEKWRVRSVDGEHVETFEIP